MTGSAVAPRIVRAGTAFRVEPWDGPAPPGGWGEAFAVYASEDPAAPAMLGTYAKNGAALVFTPRFSPAPSVRLRAVFNPPGAAPVTAWFGGIAAPPRAPTTRVLQVTPSADVWPENVLKFYVTFSAPMRIGVAWDHIRMLDADGKPMGGMFVEIDQELWDPKGQRLTVLFDPGRIKRGLIDNINEGPPLTTGGTVTLEIEAYWRDAEGGLLAEPFAKTISVAPPLRSAIDPAAWRITPAPRPTDPLLVDFDRPLDAALATRAITLSREGFHVPCEPELANEETRLLLHPKGPWTPGRHVLHADAILEDIAGNRIGRPFDLDRNEPGQRTAAAHDAEIPFDI